MAKQYNAEFKMEAVRRIARTGETVSKVAADLGVNENTMHGWVNQG
jgi:transposase